MSILEPKTMIINGKKVIFAGPVPPWYVDQKSEEEFKKRKQTFGVCAPEKGLSENVAKCVLKNVNLFKRQGVSSVSPYHAQLNRQTPHRLNQLKFAESKVFINGAQLAPILSNLSHFKRLINFLNPDLVHSIDMLYVENFADIRGFPKALKLHINKLVLHNDTRASFQALRQNIHSSSFPLKIVEIAVDNTEDPIFNNIVTGADCKMLSLILPRGFYFGMGFWSEPLSRLNHPNVVVSGSQEFAVLNLVLLANEWMLNPRPIGHKIGVITNQVDMYLKGIAEQKELQGRGGVLIKDRHHKFYFCFTISCSTNSEIVIYGTYSPFFQNVLQVPDAKIYMVQMEVRNKGTVARFD